LERREGRKKESDLGDVSLAVGKRSSENGQYLCEEQLLGGSHSEDDEDEIEALIARCFGTEQMR